MGNLKMSLSQEVKSVMETSRKRIRDDAGVEDDVVSHKKLKLMIKKGRWDLETNRQSMQKLVLKNAEIRDEFIAEMEESMDNLQEALKKQSVEVETFNSVLKRKKKFEQLINLKKILRGNILTLWNFWKQ